MAACTLSAIINVQAQGGANYGPGLRININEDGSRYLRMIFWGQIWARSSEQNPGTVINSDPAKNALDIGARRLRLLAMAQISPRYLIVMHAGINNQSFVIGGASGSAGTGGYGQGKKPQLFFHDVFNEYAILPSINPKTLKPNRNSLYLGAGLHYWWGLSRMTSASTLNFLMIDAPVFNWPLIENSDQFARQYGIYIKGALGKLHYQMHLNKPFATNLAPASGGPAIDNNGNSKAAIGGYYDLQLFDQEANTLPYRVGSYIGSKKVLNIGAGFYHNKDGTRSITSDAITRKHNISLQALDVFADIPVGDKAKNMAVTAYSVFYNYDFGPDYLRSVGIMNTGAVDPQFTGTKTLEGPGNNRIMMGTGNIWYTQAGLLLPKGKSGKLRVQPMAAYTLKNLEALNQSGHYYDIGSNFFLDGHHSRITLQYSSRPLYHPTSKKVMERAGELLLQFQVYL
ncbi:porin [Flavihumibacter stibioxidans]|uniref:Porin n=2 Tax=Flavihumibacter stibioxidans TaxID=1834163 RepID=A0ABR7M7U3_9BACT|nr:porin [Flavihumibacter stibioxidans]